MIILRNITHIQREVVDMADEVLQSLLPNEIRDSNEISLYQIAGDIFSDEDASIHKRFAMLYDANRISRHEIEEIALKEAMSFLGGRVDH